MTTASAQRTVRRFELLRELGRGATSVVYVARQMDLDRVVAVKELAVLRSTDPNLTERFLRESRLAGSLAHPNVVTVYEYFEDAGTPYIAMEYLERGSLRPFVGALTVAQVAGVLEGVLSGLAHAHARGVVHRDLKPENVLVTSTGGLKIADFGIAKALGSKSVLTLSGSTVGTPAYMAPEQAMAGEMGPATDLYAVGIIAYELLSGHVPFHGADVPMVVMLQHLNDPVPPLLDERPDLDGDLCAWVERMLAKDPESRPASAADAWDELDDLVLGSLGPRWRRESRLGEPDAAAPTAATAATMARSDQPIAPQGPPRRRRGRVVALAALGLTLLAVGVGSAVAVYGDDGKPGPQQAETTQSTSGPAQHTIGLEHGPVLTALKLDSQQRGATATLLLSGPPLRARSVRIGDDTVRDGHAWFELKQPGIEARVRRRAHGALAVRVRKGRSLVRVDVAASPGAYDSLRVRRPNGHRVLIVLTTTPRASTSHASSSPTYSPPSSRATTTTTTTTTTPTKPKPPPVKTG